VASPVTVEMDEELRLLVERLQKPEAHADDDARLRPHLTEAAQEHEDILRRSRELGNKRVYRRR